MNKICKFLKYKLVEDQELIDRFGSDGCLLLEDYRCENEFMKGICTQVTANIKGTGIGLLDLEEIADCPHYKNKNKE